MSDMKTELENFHGTAQYHKCNFGKMVCTDGMKYLFQNRQDEDEKRSTCFWIGDVVNSVQHKELVQEKSNFLVWRVIKDGDGGIIEAHWDSEEGGGYDDSKLVYRQKLAICEFPFEELGDIFEFYQQGEVLLLKGEH